MSAPSSVPAEEPRILSPQIPAWLNSRTLLLITAVVGAAIALVLWQYAKSEKNRAESNLLLETKPGPETWTKLIRDYPGQPATALAILQSAAEASSKKDAKQAAGLYEKFAREFPKHPLTGAARFAQANQLAASGDKAGAQSVYLRIMNEQPANAFRTAAAVGLARLQIQENRTEAARQVLNEILSANTGSAFLPEARALLENLPPAPTPATQLPAK
jgi:predicted negative regulator of RcsB-dependent stress response